MGKELFLTERGLEKLKEELKRLKTKDRPEVITRIQAARDFGDLSENAEYEDAKNEQAFIEGRILELEDMLKRAKVVKKEDKGTVSIGSVVVCVVDGETEEVEIVGASESDPLNGKISSESPVGKALFGHKSGETVTVNTPGGSVEYKIKSLK